MKEQGLAKDPLRKKLSMLLLCDLAAAQPEGKLTYKQISSSLNVWSKSN
jgi:hypothetical protein